MRIIHRNEEGAYSWKNYAENNHNIWYIRNSSDDVFTPDTCRRHVPTWGRVLNIQLIIHILFLSLPFDIILILPVFIHNVGTCLWHCLSVLSTSLNHFHRTFFAPSQQRLHNTVLSMDCISFAINNFNSSK